jgi:uncharacterized damage-inducible protein DinB
LTTNRTDSRIALLLEIVDQAFSRQAWHGTTLRGSIRGLSVERAVWRPGPERHNIWELVLHTAYWKYIVRRRLTGDKALSFPRKPSNWPATPEKTTSSKLKEDIALLQQEHDSLRDVIERFDPSRLHRRAPESKWTYAEHVHGIAAHDLYHAGQIQLVKKLMHDGIVQG